MKVRALPEDLVLDFVFVPHGAPWPENWVARHPDYITLPAKFVRPPGKPRLVAAERPSAPDPGAQPVAKHPSVRDAVIKGLDLIEPGVDHSGNVREFSGEFAQIVDPGKINIEGWSTTITIHPKLDFSARFPVEKHIPLFPDYVVKYYPDDSHGSDMVVVTRPTWTLGHLIDSLHWKAGSLSNTDLAQDFCEIASGCGPYPPSTEASKPYQQSR